jgi:hypothetical protein
VVRRGKTATSQDGRGSPPARRCCGVGPVYQPGRRPGLTGSCDLGLRCCLTLARRSQAMRSRTWPGVPARVLPMLAGSVRSRRLVGAGRRCAGPVAGGTHATWVTPPPAPSPAETGRRLAAGRGGVSWSSCLPYPGLHRAGSGSSASRRSSCSFVFRGTATSSLGRLNVDIQHKPDAPRGVRGQGSG